MEGKIKDGLGLSAKKPPAPSVRQTSSDGSIESEENETVDQIVTQQDILIGDD